MWRQRSRGARLTGLVLLAILVGVMAWTFLPGCKQGTGPYPVLPPNGEPPDYLPPGGVSPHIEKTRGLLYCFDRTHYALYKPYPGTDRKYIRRDSVLALAGMNEQRDSLLRRPDLLDPTLNQVYHDPRLFGFVPCDPAQVGWKDGEIISNPTDFLALQVGNWWEYNHNGQWTRTDSVVGPGEAPTAPAGQSTRVLARCRVSDTTIRFRQLYTPDTYHYDYVISAIPGRGVALHSWMLVSERRVICHDGPNIVTCPRSQHPVQRNPSFLWVSRDAFAPTTIDQCLDSLPSYLQYQPLKLFDDQIQIGDIITTWTYLTVDRNALLHRLADDSTRTASNKRCGIELVVERDTLRAFPTRRFSILCKFVVTAERAYDQLVLKRLDTVTGRYGTLDGNVDVVKLTITMYTGGLLGQNVSQFHEIYLSRGFGEVVRTTGYQATTGTRSTARLRSCYVDGRFYPQTFFSYVD